MNTDWNDLIQRYLAEQTTEEEMRRLAAALRADDALADLYLRHTELDVALEAEAASAEVTRELLSAPMVSETRRGGPWPSWRPLVAAAACVIFALILTLSHRTLPPTNEAPILDLRGDYVATLASVEECVWRGAALRVGQRIAAGTLRLQRGKALLHFDGGAGMVVIGPAELAIESSGGARVLSGKIAVHAPEEAVGFRVKTAEGSLVDLGTEFVLSVDTHGATECQVLDGEVEWHPKKDPQEIAMLAKGAARRYHEGREEILAPALLNYRDFLPALGPDAAERELLAYEPFAYSEANGPAEKLNGGTGWRSPWIGLGLEASKILSGVRMQIVPGENLPEPDMLVPSSGGRFVFHERKQWRLRPLPVAIDLAQDGVHYLSFLARGPAGPPEAGRTGRFQVNFHSSANYRSNWIGFSISAANRPFIIAQGNNRWLSDVLPGGETLFVVCKIAASRSGPDQLFMKVYGSGQELDATETTRWTVVSGELSLDLALDCLVLSVESNLPWSTPWSVDEIRFGTSWRSVVPLSNAALERAGARR